MTNSQVTSTGIAVSLAIVVALALLFFGDGVFGLFSPPEEPAVVATSTLSIASSTMSAPIPEGELPTELTATDTTVGTGAEAVPGTLVTVNYVGMLSDGTVFDASERHGEPFRFNLGAGEVIAGWDMGVAGMKVGGTRRLIIPAEYAYGAQGIPGAIPGDATLIFDVELVGVQ